MISATTATTCLLQGLAVCRQIRKQILRLLPNCFRQFCVREFLSRILPGGDRVENEISHCLLSGGIWPVLANDEKRQTGNRICVFSGRWRIDNWRAWILYQGFAKCINRRRCSLRARLNEFAASVPNRGGRDVVVNCVSQLGITYGSDGQFEHVNDSFASFPTHSDGPVDRQTCADVLGPLRTDVCEIVCENVGRPAPISTMHDDDGGMGKIYSRVVCAIEASCQVTIFPRNIPATVAGLSL